MRIMFDLMGTVFGALDMSLRPGIKDTINALRESGMRVDFWTSGPVENYRFLLKQEGLAGDVYSKNAPLPFDPDICVDDDPQSWMPGKVLKVKTHIDRDASGGLILVAELLHIDEKESFSGISYPG